MPDDTSPHGGEALHPLPERARVPQGRGATEAAPSRPAGRPPLPEDPPRLAADVEDEDADPVVESGPGVAEDSGKPSVTRQPGG